MVKYIFLHCLGQTSSSWDDTIQAMDKDWEILSPNLSDWICKEKCSYASLYSEFEKYCNQFQDTICLVGLSLGGILALQYSIEHPERVKSLVLIGTQYNMPKGLLKLQNMIFQKSDFISLCKSMMELDFSHRLKYIFCKVLVLCGDKDKANKSASLQLAELIPNSKIKIIPNAGHEINENCPYELAREIESFIK